jgi:NodT family efflux transporter outer membrane factor (OMF) lipoprotein
VRWRRAHLTLGFVGALAGCSLAPTYKTPSTAPPPPSYRAVGDWKQAEPADAAVRGPWWSIYQDAALDALEGRVSASNQNVKAALARLDEARAQTRIARAGYFPTITAEANAARERESINSPTYNTLKPGVFNDFQLEGGFVSYEVDVFGRVRNTVAAARASQQASAADLAVLDLSTQAELATDYFTLRSDDTQARLLDHTVADYAQALQLTQNLYNGGAAPLSDLEQARAQLETAKTQAADIRLRRAQTEHAIAVLIGEQASAFHIDPTPLPADIGPPAVDLGLPSALLERRPDVASAERLVAAANARIGVARAAYFPVFSLSAVAGFESTAISNWISAPSRLWALGASSPAAASAGVLTLFDGGLHRAQSAYAHAAHDEQVADYRGTVLTAYQEVEDNLAALRELEKESVSEAAAVAATASALQQAQYRYQGGIVTYLEVVTEENASLSAQLSAADIQVRRLNASVLLVKALGGGWENPLATQTTATAQQAP